MKRPQVATIQNFKERERRDNVLPKVVTVVALMFILTILTMIMGYKIVEEKALATNYHTEKMMKNKDYAFEYLIALYDEQVVTGTDVRKMMYDCKNSTVTVEVETENLESSKDIKDVNPNENYVGKLIGKNHLVFVHDNPITE